MNRYCISCGSWLPKEMKDRYCSGCRHDIEEKKAFNLQESAEMREKKKEEQMSTRCQVEVFHSGLDWEERVMLYHHTDGYPTGILPLIAAAHKASLEGGEYSSWRSGRAGKAAGFICAEDPGIFEPESGLRLHGDIEWFYEVECQNKSGGSLDEKAGWIVRVFVPAEGFGEQEGTGKGYLRMVWAGTVEAAEGEAEEIEKGEGE